MEKSKKVAALKAASEHFSSWIDLCNCFGMEHKIVNEEYYPILMISPLWSAQYDGFGSDYPLSQPDRDEVRWIMIFIATPFDPELYDHIIYSWKFHHQVIK